MPSYFAYFIGLTLINVAVHAGVQNQQQQTYQASNQYQDFQEQKRQQQIEQLLHFGTPAAHAPQTQTQQAGGPQQIHSLLGNELARQSFPQKALTYQQQYPYQPSKTTVVRQTWSGAPIVVDDYFDGVDVEQEQQLVQLAAAVQPTSTLQSRRTQTLNDAFVHYKHQLPQQAAATFHYRNADTAAYDATTVSSRRPQRPSLTPTVPQQLLYPRQARIFSHLDAEVAVVGNSASTPPWVVQPSMLQDRAPSLVGRERLERFAAYAPYFERYVQNYPRRLIPQY